MTTRIEQLYEAMKPLIAEITLSDFHDDIANSGYICPVGTNDASCLGDNYCWACWNMMEVEEND